jgi:hypothetical protein
LGIGSTDIPKLALFFESGKSTRIPGWKTIQFSIYPEMIIVFVVPQNDISLILPEIRFLNIPLEIKYVSYQHVFGTEIALIYVKKSSKAYYR